jgi:integrase
VASGKTKAARRNVPVHPTFDQGRDRKMVAIHRLSASVVSRRFTRWRRSQGITRDKVTFHSLRKNFTESLENAHVSPNLVAALLGHGRGFSLDVYSPAGPEFELRADAVAKVQYKGLKLAVS